MKRLLLLLLASSAFAQLSKVEPPFWYVGMQNPQLQIMFYGKNISQYTVTAPTNIPVTSVIRTENPNYLFVTINTAGLSPSDVVFSFSLKGKQAFTRTYELRARKQGSRMRKGYDSSDVMYLLMPDRFANGNPANDNTADTAEKADRTINNGRHGGDLQGIIDHLDYIQQTGATAIWSTPLCEDNDPRGSYHGYAESDVYRIDPRYGTNDDYLKLSSELHKRGMKLVLDYVTNHWGAEHWMIKDLPTYDWIHQFPGYAQSNYRMTTQFDPNRAESDKRYCVDGWFVKSMPDLNQSNPLVVTYLTQNAIWWIEYADLDGFRVDTYSYNDKEGIAKWTKAITDEYPYFNIVGEVWMHDQTQMAYWQKDSRIGAIDNYNSYLPSVMDFTLHDAIGSVFNEDQPSWDRGIVKFYENFTNDFLYPNINNMLVFAENHDTQRFNHLYGNDIRKYKLAMALIGTIRGIPQVYYGSEIGMAGNKDQGDGDIRRDFPGGWPGDTQNAFTRAGRTAEQNAYFDFTSRLFNWRKTASVIHHGKTKHFLPENNVYVYFRYDDSHLVMVVLNNHPERQTIKTDRFREILNASKGRDILTEQTVDLSSQITIEGKTPMIIEIR
ncbi:MULTISPECIES: glycoside hydrolase family 13 protein [unclassified Flavobacterium]|uniref:glycoside hydrolase family 13 protein n=1 Tax=unclassified Flavobacterium TaxID=196869 RepID=UPI001F13F100|nr:MULTISPECIES: glycoside hydrolase family 13 protein [unclassified Flavobacterium]UMY65961.1 glycoside hydrolase family 13 protein [Flavobacterium sp. HJ-32-4]